MFAQTKASPHFQGTLRKRENDPYFEWLKVIMVKAYFFRRQCDRFTRSKDWELGEYWDDRLILKSLWDFRRNFEQPDQGFTYLVKKACTSLNGTIIVKSARQNFARTRLEKTHAELSVFQAYSRRKRMRAEIHAKLKNTGDTFYIVGRSDKNENQTEHDLEGKTHQPFIL